MVGMMLMVVCSYNNFVITLYNDSISAKDIE